MKLRWFSIGILPLMLLVGCNPVGTPSLGETSNMEGSKYQLKEDPKGAMSVIEARISKETDVVVVGRIGGDSKPLNPGKAIATLIDLKFPVTDECESPWDFCEVPDKQRKAAVLTVKLVDETGKPVASSLGNLFGVKPLSVIVVKGKAQRDEYGNVVVLATGVYVREK